MANVMPLEAQGLHAHPAFDAWTRLDRGLGDPKVIVPLKVRDRKSAKSAVYRLDGIGPRAGSIVAKRCKVTTAEAERTIYEEILPHLEVWSPRYYGCTSDPEPEFCWLFLEFIDGEPFSPDDSDHKRAAAAWFARVHVAAVRSTALTKLPDRGPSYYLDQLRSARSTLCESKRNEIFHSIREVLTSLIVKLDSVEADWQRIVQLCSSLSPTLVHGDFVAKNVRVREERTGLRVYAFDWETGGVGIPSADLVGIDRKRYWEHTRVPWPHLSPEDVGRLAAVGHLFRTIAGIYWSSLSLPYGWAEKRVGQLRLYDSMFVEAACGDGMER